MQIVVQLYMSGRFLGLKEQFFDLLESFLPYLKEPVLLLFLKYHAEGAHPAHPQWLETLEVRWGIANTHCLGRFHFDLDR
jgi:hypothetical protein